MNKLPKTQDSNMENALVNTGIAVVSKWSLRGIGYAMIGSVVSGFAGWASLEAVLFGDGALFANQALAVLGVGGVFVFGGEFLANYIESLNQGRQFRRELLRHIENTQDELEKMNKKFDSVANELGRIGDNKGTGFGAKAEL